MRLTRNYEYAYGLIKARMGNRLNQYEYEAILGCKEPRDLSHVLCKTVYGDSLARFEVKTFENIIEVVTSSASNYIENLVKFIPKSDMDILIEYKKFLESRSLVNFLKSKIRTDNIFAMIDVISFDSFPLDYYDIGAPSKENYDFPELMQIIENSISLVKKHDCVAPLLKIILFFYEMISKKIPKSSSAKWRSLSKLVNHMGEATIVESLILSSQSGIATETTKKWFSVKSNVKENLFNMFRSEKNFEQVISILKKTRYGSCLEKKSHKNVNDIMERFPYCVMAKEAHSILAGYPFLPSTVAAGMMLILVEVRNIKLAIAAIAGRLDKLKALRLMTIT
ncbi:V0D/AC39 family V-type ATPase subunit [[Eubacterium] cellulosolvens]